MKCSNGIFWRMRRERNAIGVNNAVFYIFNSHDIAAIDSDQRYGSVIIFYKPASLFLDMC